MGLGTIIGAMLFNTLGVGAAAAIAAPNVRIDCLLTKRLIYHMSYENPIVRLNCCPKFRNVISFR